MRGVLIWTVLASCTESDGLRGALVWTVWPVEWRIGPGSPSNTGQTRMAGAGLLGDENESTLQCVRKCLPTGRHGREWAATPEGQQQVCRAAVDGRARIVQLGRGRVPLQRDRGRCQVDPPTIGVRTDINCPKGLRLREINDEMLNAAAAAIADVVSPDQLNASYIVPSVFDENVSKAVARAVVEASRSRVHIGGGAKESALT
mgnify:CR=1 FL=1